MSIEQPPEQNQNNIPQNENKDFVKIDPVAANGSIQPKILSLAIKDLKVLYTAYMPFVINGGIFIPTKKAFNMGDTLPLIISLLDENNKYSVTGKIVWLTPNNAHNRTPGIGVQFTGPNAEELSNKIKGLIADLQSTGITNTM